MSKTRNVICAFTLIASVAGVVTTAILAAKASPKAEKKLEELKKNDPNPSKMDIVKNVGPVYISTAVSGALTITCIVATNVLNRKNQASLASAYALLSHNFQEYRAHVKKIFGDDADQKVIDSVVIEQAERGLITSQTFASIDSLAVDMEEEDRLFYDSYSGRYFNAPFSQVLQAEYHLNRNYVLGGNIPVNMFYDFLGLEHVPDGDLIGWDICESEIYWLDFDHRLVKLEDSGGLECCIIDFVFAPWRGDGHAR